MAGAGRGVVIDVGERVPAYLGRVLDHQGHPVGTCFAVGSHLLVTAAHVLGVLECAVEGGKVRVDPLRGGEPLDVAVDMVDRMNDLAVLRAHRPLGMPACTLAASSPTAVTLDVVVTGVVTIGDPGYDFRFVEAPGLWAGHAVRRPAEPPDVDDEDGVGVTPGTGDGSVLLARVRSPDVMPGMSGAPVRLVEGDAVVGVVSARYNAPDGWLRDTIWVAPVEAVARLLPRLGNGADGPPPGVATLTWRNPEGHLAVVELRGDRLTIGRAAPPDHVPEVDLGQDERVSRHHCALTRERGRWWLRDCESRNHTFLRRRGQRRIRRVKEPTCLQHGDVICIPTSLIEGRRSEYWEFQFSDPLRTA